MLYKDLIKQIKKNNPKANLESIKKAYSLIKKIYQGKKRKSGEDYINHPLSVALMLAKARLDEETIAAALLHDIPETGFLSFEEIRKEFGPRIGSTLESLDKIKRIEYKGEEKNAENLIEMLLSIAGNLRVALIRLVERYDNLQTLKFLPKERQKAIGRETLEIYAPIANRLGMGWLKGALEDAAFPYVYPREYKKLVNKVAKLYGQREKYLQKIRPKVEKILKKEGVKIISIDYRSKHYWSLYKKLQRYNMNLNKIYDLVAFRIILPTIEQCYNALGVLHKYWKPLPGRIKDYIAIPKPNGYRSLHTTVFCDNGVITEFQLRTPQMHQEAENGIAAHWYYDERKTSRKYNSQKSIPIPKQQVEWNRELRRWQEEIKSSSTKNIPEAMKIDLFKDRIFVFTPKGDIIDLPKGSCPIDFAYAIHSDLGEHCVLAKVNAEIKPLDYQLQNSDIVEIVTARNKKPSADWLKFVKTSRARSEIKKHIQSTIKQENKSRAKQTLLEKNLSKKKSKKKTIKKSKKQLKGEVVVAHNRGILIHLSKCCHPQPKDKIKAYITQNRGASIHTVNCPNLKRLEKKWPQRVVDAYWVKKK